MAASGTVSASRRSRGVGSSRRHARRRPGDRSGPRPHGPPLYGDVWLVDCHTRHAHRHLRSLHENGHVAWTASSVPETRRVVSDLTNGLISHLPGTIVVALEDSGLAFFDARNARPLMTIPYVIISSVE